MTVQDQREREGPSFCRAAFSSKVCRVGPADLRKVSVVHWQFSGVLRPTNRGSMQRHGALSDRGCEGSSRAAGVT